MSNSLRSLAGASLVVLMLVGLALNATGCAIGGGLGEGGMSSVRMLTGERATPRPAEYPISLTPNDYQEPYEEIAVIQTRPCRDDMLDTIGTADLRDLARKVGADAVVHVSRRSETGEEVAYRPGNLLRSGTRFVERSALVGVAVHFRREEGK